MYSSRVWRLVFLMLLWAVAAGPALAQPASPAAEPPRKPAAEAKKPAVPPGPEGPESAEAESAQASEEGEPVSPEQPGVPWDDAIERIVAQRYPRGVDDLRRIQDQVQAVVRHARPATVAVQIGDSVGSGVIVSEDGLVLTAGHVAMEPSRPVRFLFADGSRARGMTLGVNRTIDSGMMRITDKGPWPHVKVAAAGELGTGDWVVGLGQPNGYFRDRQPPVRIGRVLYQDDDVINTDATLVGGDSGGPLLNLKGEVVGIHSRIGRRITSNFHVPISTYELTWDRLLAGEMWGGGIAAEEQVQYRPILGVTCNPQDGACRVVQVLPGMPADQAGIKAGDVIKRFGHNEVGSFDDLVGLLLKQRPGSRIKLEVERDGKALEFSVRLDRVTPDYPGAAPLESSGEAPRHSERLREERA